MGQLKQKYSDSVDFSKVNSVLESLCWRCHMMHHSLRRNKKAVEKIMRWDIFNLQYLLPRVLLQIPYDILNRINRQKLQDSNNALVDSVTIDDFCIKPTTDKCFDYFCVATK